MSTTANKWGIALGVLLAIGGYLTSEAFLNSGKVSEDAAFWITTVFAVIGVGVTAYNSYQVAAKNSTK